MAKHVANAAATQAAERAAIEQREIIEKQLGQASIAQQAANAVLNAHAISQTSSQQSVSTSPVVQPGQPVQAFNQNVQASGVQPLGTGATQGQQVISGTFWWTGQQEIVSWWYFQTQKLLVPKTNPPDEVDGVVGSSQPDILVGCC